jgi:hypothetical protein
VHGGVHGSVLCVCSVGSRERGRARSVVRGCIRTRACAARRFTEAGRELTALSCGPSVRHRRQTIAIDTKRLRHFLPSLADADDVTVRSAVAVPAFNLAFACSAGARLPTCGRASYG